jgi:hypothetical protein
MSTLTPRVDMRSMFSPRVAIAAEPWYGPGKFATDRSREHSVTDADRSVVTNPSASLRIEHPRKLNGRAPCGATHALPLKSYWFVDWEEGK